MTSRSVQRTYSLGAGGLTKESEVSVRHRRAAATSSSTPRRPLGWKLQRSLNERIGLYVGVTTIVLLVLAGIVVGIVALAGGFS